MTATNIIVQSNAAHLVTDAAFYDEDGVVRLLQHKIVASERLRMAVAVGQRLTVDRIAPWLDAQMDQEKTLHALPDFCDRLKAENITNGGAEGELNDVGIFVVLWSDRRDQAEGWILSTGQAYFGEDYTPGTLADVDHLLSPPIKPAKILRHGNHFPAKFEACRDGRLILEAQRRSTEHTQGQHRVGGWGCLVTVRRSGMLVASYVSGPKMRSVSGSRHSHHSSG